MVYDLFVAPSRLHDVPLLLVAALLQGMGLVYGWFPGPASDKAADLVRKHIGICKRPLDHVPLFLSLCSLLNRCHDFSVFRHGVKEAIVTFQEVTSFLIPSATVGGVPLTGRAS